MIFLDKENLSTIFEILIENNHSDLKTIIKNNNIRESDAIVKKFNNIAFRFNDSNKTNNLSLIEMNKQFILFLINNVNIFTNREEERFIYEQQISSKNKTKNEITHQDIKKNRRNEFELQLENKKNEFGSLTIPKPPLPNFSDNIKDEPIKNIDNMMKEVMERRNYDTQQFQQDHSKININPTSNIKYIKIGDEYIDDSIVQNSVIDITNIQPQIQENKKSVSWDNEKIQIEDNIGLSFLQKIRQIPREDIDIDIANIQEQKIINYDKIMDKLIEIETKLDLLILQL